MRATTRLARPLALLAALLAVPAFADVVTLKNGDRISGTVVRKEDGTLTMKTAYAGELKIAWAEVVTVSTDGPVVVQLADGTEVVVRLAVRSDGDIEPVRPPGTHRVPLGKIAFINPTPEQSGKGVSYKRRLKFAANAVEGNSRAHRWNAEGEFAARARSHRYRVMAQGTRASEAGRTTESNWRTTGNYDWFLRPKQFVYAKLAFEQDRFRDLKLRSELGVGYGHQFVESKDTELSVQAGPEIVHAMAYAGSDETFPAAGWTLHYAHWLWSHRAQVYLDQTGFWSLETTRDVVIHTSTGLRLPIAAGLAATTELKIDWDNDPAPGTRSTDATVSVGVAYDW